MLEQKHKVEPIVRAVEVDCDREEAFRIFTERFAKWWPLALYSIHKEHAKDCEMQPGVGGRIFERTKDRETSGFQVAKCPINGASRNAPIAALLACKYLWNGGFARA